MYIFGLARVGLDLFAETTDMYVHSSDISRILISPNDIQKVLTAVNFVRVEHQKFQHVKLFCGKIDLLACNKYTTALAVQFQISGLDRLCLHVRNVHDA